MRLDLDKALCAAAPNLYRDRNALMSETCMCWGFDCGDGWFNLMLEASLELEALGLPDLRADQVKEKWGTLRLYISGGNDAAEAIVDRAEARSAVECEVCGAAASLRGRSWLSTLCDKHAK